MKELDDNCLRPTPVSIQCDKAIYKTNLIQRMVRLGLVTTH